MSSAEKTVTFTPFSLTETSPFDWKDDYLVTENGSDLFILPAKQWQGREIKDITSSSTMTCASIASIRDAFLKGSSQIEKTDIKKIFMANKNISCLNEKVAAYNKAHSDPSEQLEELPLLLLPEITAKKTAVLTTDRLLNLSAPESGHEPNVTRANAWVNNQHASLQPLAYTLAASVIENYVDFPTFVATLDESMKIAEKKIGKKSFGIVTWGKPEGASGTWVRSLLQLAKTPAAEMSILSEKEETTCDLQYTKKSKKAPQIKEWILVDDAAYSGDQLFSHILPAVIKELKQLSSKGKMRVHIAIPYISSHVLQKLEAKAKEKDSVQVTCCHAKIMSSTEEIAKTLSMEDRKTGDVIADTLGRSPFPCTTYFAHKVGDGLSLPRKLSDGMVFSRTYTGLSLDWASLLQNKKWKGTLAFVPEFVPHYKTRIKK